MPLLSYQARLALSPPASHRAQCNEMKSNERTTLYVDFSHVQDHNTELADAIEADFHYLEPFLRQALKNRQKQKKQKHSIFMSFAPTRFTHTGEGLNLSK